MPIAGAGCLLTAGTQAVPVHPLALPASALPQGTAPAEILTPADTLSPGRVFTGGCSFLFVCWEFLKAQVDEMSVW